MIPSPRFREAFKTALAMILAYGIALSMDWDKPMWAAFAVASISLATAGQSINKGAMRMLGTLVAAVFSLTLVALFPQDRWWLMVGLSTFVGLCTYMMGGPKRQYVWNVAGFVSLIICMESIPETGSVFDLAVLRSLETGLGILCYTLVTLLLWPVSTAGELDAAVRGLASTQHRLYQGYLKLLQGKGETEDLHALRMQQLQQINQLGVALAGARADTYEVWELRGQWARFEADSRQVMDAMETWREGFDEAQELDLEVLLPDFPDLAKELDTRFGEVERMLAGQAPDGVPSDLHQTLNMDAARSLSHFQKAALAVSRAQLGRLDLLTRSLFTTLADIKGFVPPSESSAEPPARRSRLVPDADRIAAAVRVMAGIWIAYLLWIFVEVPGGVGIVILAGSLGMALASHPQLPIRLVIKPAATAIAFAGGLYIFVMPRLSTFTELGLLIFAVTFAVCYLFYKPQQALGRTIGLVFFTVLAGISNEQTYSLLSVANTTMMLVLVLTVLAFAANIPLSPRPERAFLRLLRRFFRGCAYLVSTLRWDPARTPSRLERWRRAYHARELAVLPPVLALWARFIDTARLTGTTPDQLQGISSQIQALAYRMHETLEARAAHGSEGTLRELHGEIDAWRAGLQEIFRGLTLDPGAADHADLRSKLNGKLERMEAHIEDVLNSADTASISLQEAENTYRLLGAHRGLSAAVVAFAQRAPAVDWPRLREARF